MRRRALGAVVALAVGACEAAPPGPIPVDAPELRPPDALLADAALQAVVERQADRDAGALVARLGADRADVRARAALALGSVQSAEAVPELEAALADPDAGVRRDAAFALGQAGVPGAAVALAARLARERDVEARREILEALGKLAGPASLAALMEADVGRQEEPIRVLALARLGAVVGVSSDAAVERLAGLLNARDARVREAAAYHFGRSNEVPGPELAARLRAALAGYAAGDPAAMHLVPALGRVGDPADGALLVGWATDAADWRTRVNAVQALGGLGPDAERSAMLVGRLDDPSPHVAMAAAQLLGAAAPDPALVRRVGERLRAGGLPWQVEEPLLPLLAGADERELVLGWADARDPSDPWAQAAALRALAALPGTDILERLEEAAGAASPRTADDAVRALALRWRAERVDARRHADYLRIFAAALRRPDLRTTSVAATTLADSLLAPAGIQALADAWGALGDDARRKRAVLAALGGSGVPSAEAALRAARADGDASVRSAAEAALAELRGEEAAEPEPAPAQTPLAPEARLDWDYLATLGSEPRLVLDTDQGRIVVRLDPLGAPQTVQTIARFAEEGRYDGVVFHRVVSNFVIQGGDFGRGDGSGGPGFSIRSELSEAPFLRGTIGMASAGKDTEGSQWFINHVMTPHLDGAYTTFGWVVEGMDVVDRILVGHRILTATVQRGR